MVDISSSGAHEVGNYHLHVSIFHDCELCEIGEEWNTATAGGTEICTWVGFRRSENKDVTAIF